MLVLGALVIAPTMRAASHSDIKIGRISQQLGWGRAAIEAHISVRSSEPGRSALRPSQPISRVVEPSDIGGAVDKLPEAYPPLPTDSALVRNAQPAGPGSFWYPIGSGRACIYVQDAATPCFTLVGARGGSGGPRLDPEAVAVSVADRLALFPGRIGRSPTVSGLAGAASWFWLDPVPVNEELSVSLAGETVRVTAEPSAVEWAFGDGANFRGGAGRPYRPGPPPPDAVAHVYETRCLPGDPGRDPYVLGSCRSDGYEVQAIVLWRILYAARGPVQGSGALSARTTGTSIAYPVSEARAFLVAGESR